MLNTTLGKAKNGFLDMIEYVMGRVQFLTIVDWTMLKSCLVSFGILLGSSFSGFFKKIKPIIAFIALFTWMYTIIRIFFPIIKDLIHKRL